MTTGVRVFGAAVVIAAAAAAFVLLQDESTEPASEARGSSESTQLPPLPVGEPRMKSFNATLLEVDPKSIPGRSVMVFVGKAIDRGGSEIVAAESADSGPAVTVHRIRFEVERVFRGTRVDVVDLTALDAVELDPFVLGERYVVFADERTFGNETTPRLAAVGYWQGAFHVQPDGHSAVSGRGDKVNTGRPLDGIERGKS